MEKFIMIIMLSKCWSNKKYKGFSMDKVYVIIQNDDGASDGFGDYVTLFRIFTDRKEANKKLKELECEYKK